jgi:hypothetical protein
VVLLLAFVHCLIKIKHSKYTVFLRFAVSGFSPSSGHRQSQTPKCCVHIVLYLNQLMDTVSMVCLVNKVKFVIW